MQSPKDGSSTLASAQNPLQSGAAGDSRVVSQPKSPAREALPPSSPSSIASSFSSTVILPEDGDAGTPSPKTTAGGCEFARRVRNLPAVQALLGAYAGAKAYPVVCWVLQLGEQAALFANAVCRPVVVVCRVPMSCGDWCLCKALDVTEAAFPCISMPPSKVYYGAQDRVVNCVCCPPRAAARCLAKISSFKQLY